MNRGSGMRTSSPLVSFILPSYNREVILHRVLTEIEQRRFKFDYEVIVLDNNSVDGSVAMVQRDFPQVRLFDLKQNLGAISRNIGIDRALGDYIVMLDDDSYPLTGAVESALQVFQADSEKHIGCIAFNIQRADGSYETAGILTAFTGCAAMFPKWVFSKVGMYPEDYLFYVEEYDLSCRLWQAGYSILNFKELIFVHLKTEVNRDFNRNLERLVRNNILLWSKYLPDTLRHSQIDMELWRYENIGRKENALVGYESGVKLGLPLRRLHEADNRFRLSQEVAEKVLHLPVIRSTLSSLREKGCQKIVVFNAGKVLHLIVEDIVAQGMQVAAIIDDNKYMQQTGFKHFQVHARSSLTNLSYDAIVLGSTSLALSDTFERELTAMGLDVPLVRLANYDQLNQFI